MKIYLLFFYFLFFGTLSVNDISNIYINQQKSTVSEECHAEGELAFEGVDLEPLFFEPREKLFDLMWLIMRIRSLVIAAE